VDEAAALVRRSDPDVVFLDIQMPAPRLELSGSRRAPRGVRHAHDSSDPRIRVTRLDYLLKPVHPARLAVRSAACSPPPARRPARASSRPMLTFLDRGAPARFRPACAEFVCIRGAGDYSEVVLPTSSCCRAAAQDWEARLPTSWSASMHRDHHLEQVERVGAGRRGRFRVVLRGLPEPYRQPAACGAGCGSLG